MKFLFLSLILIFSFSESSGFAALRCENIFKSTLHTDSSLYAEQIVFSSSQMKVLFSQLQTLTQTSSPQEALKELKSRRSADFAALQKRIHLVITTIETLAEAENFSRLTPKTKSLIYQDLTESLLAAESSSGWRSFLKWKRGLSFSKEPHDDNILSIIEATREIRQDWHIHIEIQDTLSKYFQAVTAKRLILERNFAHAYSGFIVLQMTYKQGVEGISEIAHHCERLLTMLENYDSTVATTVNEDPIDEAVALRDQLHWHLQKLDVLFQKLSQEQRASLRTAETLKSLQSYESKLDAEISLHNRDLSEMLSVARLWESLNQSQ